MNVLSLFDGISCGQYALKASGKKVNNYFASEIEFDPVLTTMKQFPKTIQLGDVRFVRAEALPHIDLLIGGSPCQGFSFSGKKLNFEDPRSKLFFEFHRLYRELKARNPRLKFLLENVVMREESEKVITDYMGVEPLRINSELFSAQARRRLYWTNIKVDPLPDKPHKETMRNIVDSKVKFVESEDTNNVRIRTDSRAWKQTRRVIPLDKKYPTLVTHNNALVYVDFKTCRYLTINEMEKLQGLPKDYTLPSGPNFRARQKALGNGWQVDTIKFLFKNL